MELVALVKRGVMEAVAAELGRSHPSGSGGRRSTGRRGATLRTSSLPRPSRNPGLAPGAEPLSLRSYERMAVRRALAESEGRVPAAAGLLGIGQSTMYRRMGALGVQGGDTRPAPEDPLQAAGEPLSFEAYEKAALTRALAEAHGHKVSAAKLLGIGKSTMFRKLARHGIA